MQLTRLVVAFSVLAPSFALAQGWVDRTGLNNPPPRHSHGMAYDPVRGYTVMAGGIGGPSGPNGNGSVNDTWTWDGTQWTAHAATLPSSTYARVTRLCFDPISGRVLCARTSTSGSNVDIHGWDGAQWLPMGSIALCSNAYNFVMAFDWSRNVMLLYGLTTYYGCQQIHVWDGTSWSHRQCPSVPSWWTNGSSLEDSIHMTWDPSSGRAVLTAGDDMSTNYGTRMFEWTGVNWQQRFPSTRPAAFGATTTDTLNGCGIMLDSDVLGPTSQLPGHTWIFRNGSFQRLSVQGEPMLRIKTAMAFDSARGVTVLFGGTGYIGNSYFSDTWELTLGAPASYTSFGGGCPGSRGVPQLTAQGTSLPRIGTTFTAQATNLPWTGLAFLFLGLSNTSYSGTPLPANLGFLGAPACNLLCSGDEVYILPNALGSTSWSFTVPPYPGLSFYNQVLPLDPTANSLGLTLSNAARGVIGL
jgi:hypothetical protein